MNSLVLEPTYSNLYSALKSDSIGRNTDVCAFVDLLNSMRHLRSIAVNSEWGSGKTFFVMQTKMILESLNDYYPDKGNKSDLQSIYKKYRENKEIKIEPYLCVYLDAWSHDNDEDPAMSIIDAILEEVVGAEFNNEIDFNIGKFVKNIIDDISGKSISKYLECIESVDYLQQYKNAKKQDNSIREFLKEILVERGNRLILFVDELDRCKPDYAVRLLERIKHFWNEENITIVYSVNIAQLQHTIKKFYGNDFDAIKYLTRMFDFYFDLPECDIKRFYSSIGIPNRFDLIQETCISVMKYYGMGLRDSAKFFGNVTMAINKYYNAPDGSLNRDPFGNANALLYYCFAPVMIGMIMFNPSEYHSFTSGNNIDILFEIIGDDLIDYYSGNFFANNESSHKENFKQFYDIVFNNKIDVDRIGKVHIRYDMKQRLLKIVSGISGIVNSI